MDSDEDDEEPQNEPGTSSNSQTTVPVLPLQQGPAASANAGDEDREYIAISAVHRVRTLEEQYSVQISTL